MRGGHGGGGAFRSPGGGGRKDLPTIKSDVPHWKILMRTLPYAWPVGEWKLRFGFVMAIIFAALGSMTDLATPIITANLVDSLSGKNPAIPLATIIAWSAIRFGGNFCLQLRDIAFAAVASHTERRIALETFQHLQRLPLSYHLKRETGAILRLASRGSQSFGSLLRIMLFQIMPVFFQLIVASIYLFSRYDFYFALLTIGIIVSYFLFTFYTTDWRDKYRREMNAKDNEYNQKAADALLNFETVKYFNSEIHEQKRFGKALMEYTEASINAQRSLALLNSGQNLIISVGLGVAMYLSARKVSNGEMSIGDFILIQGLILSLYQPLGFLGTYYRMIKSSLNDVESMFRLLAEPRDALDGVGSTAVTFEQPEIKFENVSFAYTPENPILKSLSFTIPKGARYAIVGGSGGGKSTIVRLLYRFYEVNQGKITINGIDIRDLTQYSLRSQIAIIPQDSVLFSASIGYNIQYGSFASNPDGASQEEIENAARLSSLRDFILTQPQGFDTQVGERGLRLSGGEKQRVAIARALLKNSPFIIMDECTSSLDNITEMEISRAVERIAVGKTCLTIAHRLTTVQHADCILVIEKGELAEMGTHEELLARNGIYSSLWKKQEKSAKLQFELNQNEKELLELEENYKQFTTTKMMITETKDDNEGEKNLIVVKPKESNKNNETNTGTEKGDEIIELTTSSSSAAAAASPESSPNESQPLFIPSNNTNSSSNDSAISPAVNFNDKK